MEKLPVGLITTKNYKRPNGKNAEFKKYPIVFSNLRTNNESISSFLINSTDTLFPYSTGAAYLNGKHYLVDAVGNMMIVKENDAPSEFVRNHRYERGFFVFHFGSSIGTYQIEIRREHQDTKIFPVIVICSPTGRADKCYYYAPDYNLERFEEAQGYIASNHFNAKTSSVSFNGVFYLMSVRLGEHFIKMSKTLALNRIRKTEELEKGWKKDEIQLPAEFKDLDPVHVMPLIDSGKLLLIIVARSIELSNTLYSVLFEAERKFLTLGREWIGHLWTHGRESVCFSKLFAQDDPNYTDQKGINNDECEYFANAIINDDLIFVQNFVFEVLVKIEFNFDKIVIEFVRQTTKKHMHVTSNPYFVFHDDVFPAFSKNTVAQLPYPYSLSTSFRKTIIPGNFFSSFKELTHISTIEIRLDGADSFRFAIDFRNELSLAENRKILECNFFNGITLVSLGVFSSGSLWLDSDFIERRIILDASRLEMLGINIYSSDSIDFFLQVSQNLQTIDSIQSMGLEKINNKKLRIHKFDDRTIIKDFIYFSGKEILIMGKRLYNAFSISLDGSRNSTVRIKANNNVDYVNGAPHALVKNMLFIFGGYSNGRKIVKLEGCQLYELSRRLIHEYNGRSAALSVENSEKALICFEDKTSVSWHPVSKKCEFFNSTTSMRTFATKFDHFHGKLALYRQKPTTVGSQIGKNEKNNKVETLDSSGWSTLADFPKNEIYGHILMGLPSGSLLLAGGIYNDWNANTGIWLLDREKWRRIGDLKECTLFGSAIMIKNSIFIVEGHARSYAIQRLDFEGDELTNKVVIGFAEYSTLPILFEISTGYCAYK